MLHKKLFVIFLSVCMLLTACSLSPYKNTSETTVSQTSDETRVTIPKSEYKTIDPPDDGWTIDLLNEVTYIGGKQVTFPITLSQLPEDFTIADSTFHKENNERAMGILYKDKYFCTVVIENVQSENEQYDNLPVSFIYMPIPYNTWYDYENVLIINGVTFNSTLEFVKKQLGNQYVYDSQFNVYNYYYALDDCSIEIFIDEKSNVLDAMIIYYRRKPS
jgi:major membrane immunogen (membrane-anchored lipoprotein)